MKRKKMAGCKLLNWCHKISFNNNSYITTLVKLRKPAESGPGRTLRWAC